MQPAPADAVPGRRDRRRAFAWCNCAAGSEAGARRKARAARRFMAEALPCHAGVLDPAASTEVADPRHAVSWHAGSQAGALSAQLAMERRTAGYRLDTARAFTVSVMHCHDTVMTLSSPVVSCHLQEKSA